MTKINNLSARLKCLRENLCRPYGARVNFPLYPALKRWANLFRAYGAGFPATSSHCRCRNIVLTQTLKPCPDAKRVQVKFFRSHFSRAFSKPFGSLVLVALLHELRSRHHFHARRRHEVKLLV